MVIFLTANMFATISKAVASAPSRYPSDFWERPTTYWSLVRDDLAIDFQATPDTPTAGQTSSLSITLHDLKSGYLNTTEAHVALTLQAMRDPHLHFAVPLTKIGETPTRIGRFRARIRLDSAGPWVATVLIHMGFRRRYEVRFPIIAAAAAVPR